MSCTERAAIELVESDILTWRSIACRLLQSCKKEEFSYVEFDKFLKKELGKKSSTTQRKHFEGLFEDLKGSVNATLDGVGSEISSSINKAKGLQADAVLVVAKDEGELQKFLETDREKREADKADFCRLGYVASTRARELLCFGCLKAVSSSTQSFLKNLGICLRPKQDKD